MPDVKPANPKPCADCPWRTANQGRPHPHGFYTKRNLRRLWAGLRRGAEMSCHPTDSRMAEFSGYEHQADREALHECAGALVLVQREVDRFQDAAREADAAGQKDAYQRYRRAHPRGLLREGIAEVLGRVLFAGTPLAGGAEVAMRTPNLNEPGISHPDLVPWEPK